MNLLGAGYSVRYELLPPSGALALTAVHRGALGVPRPRCCRWPSSAQSLQSLQLLFTFSHAASGNWSPAWPLSSSKTALPTMGLKSAYLFVYNTVLAVAW